MKSVDFTPSAIADMRRLDPPVRLRIQDSLGAYANTGAGNIKRLRGMHPPQFRLRVGDWRVIFDNPDPATIRVLAIDHRSEAYR